MFMLLCIIEISCKARVVLEWRSFADTDDAVNISMSLMFQPMSLSKCRLIFLLGACCMLNGNCCILDAAL